MKFIHKIFFSISVIVGVSTILFILFRFIMDPVQMLVGQRMDAQTLQNIQKEFGLHLPLYQQYLNYLNDLSPVGIVKAYHQGIKCIGDFGLKYPYLGQSFYYKERVWSLFLQHIPATFLLATLSVGWAFLLSYQIGKYLYLKNSALLITLALSISKFLIAFPSFIISILLLWWLGLEWNLLPISGYFVQRDVYTLKVYYDFSYWVLPVLALGLRPFAIFLEMILQLLEQESQKDYIRTARAKGLSKGSIYSQHLFPNLLPTLISLFFNWWASLMTGAFFVEYIFDYPGIGKLLVEAILQNDYPTVSGLCILSALLFIIINLLNDLLVKRLR